MSALETRTFRADNLDAVLGAVREELGPDAIVVRQREGIIGGLGGFFGKRCVEVDVECPPEPIASPKPSAMPARAATDAYAAVSTPTDEPLVLDEVGDLFQSLIGDNSIFGSALSDALDREESKPGREREPLDTIGSAAAASVGRAAALMPVTNASSLTLALTAAGLDLRLAESIVAEADQQLRVFEPGEPFENQVREVLASRIATKRLSGRYRRRVIALVGAPGSGKSSVAARLCAAHVASGKRVLALSLAPVRATLELARLTEEIDVELLSADHPDLVEFALNRMADAEVVVVDTPGIETRDDAGWARLHTLLGPLAAHETHLLVPGHLDAAGIDVQLGAASQQLRIDRLLLTHLEASASPGVAVAASIRAGIPISATATSTRLTPADPYRLAARILR